MEIKQADIDDAEAVYAVVQAGFGEYRDALPVPVSALDETMEDVRREISGGHVLLATEDGEAVGTVRYELRPDHLYVGRLAVSPAYRRRGVGAALMTYIEKLAPTLGHTRIRLATRQSMPSNLLFYEQLGYKVIQRLAHERGPDIAVWFEKEVGGQS